jgi:hypothetical protein
LPDLLARPALQGAAPHRRQLVALAQRCHLLLPLAAVTLALLAGLFETGACPSGLAAALQAILKAAQLSLALI